MDVVRFGTVPPPAPSPAPHPPLLPPLPAPPPPLAPPAPLLLLEELPRLLLDPLLDVRVGPRVEVLFLDAAPPLAGLALVPALPEGGAPLVGFVTLNITGGCAAAARWLPGLPTPRVAFALDAPELDLADAVALARVDPAAEAVAVAALRGFGTGLLSASTGGFDFAAAAAAPGCAVTPRRELEAALDLARPGAAPVERAVAGAGAGVGLEPLCAALAFVIGPVPDVALPAAGFWAGTASDVSSLMRGALVVGWPGVAAGSMRSSTSSALGDPNADPVASSRNSSGIAPTESTFTCTTLGELKRDRLLSLEAWSLVLSPPSSVMAFMIRVDHFNLLCDDAHRLMDWAVSPISSSSAKSYGV